jgi:L-asparaginase
MSITIFVTGGTFDKEYNELDGKLFFKDSHLSEMLALGRCKVQVEIRTLMMIDSLEMTEKQRTLILEECRQSSTERLLGKEIKAKTIILTGAMVPYKFGSSDGMFNLGSALAFVQTLPPGVYVAMNGRYFLWDNVRKNKQTGEFEEARPAGKN